MTDKEKIKEEIERRISQFEAKYPKDLGGYWNDEESAAFDCAEEYKQFLLFIDSLPEEPARDDLEEASEKYIFPEGKDKYGIEEAESNGIYFREEKAKHFKAGAEWQKQKDEELFSKDSWNYIEENYPDISQEEKLRLYDISIKSRLAGANAIKHQMMKDAVEGEVHKGYVGNQIVVHSKDGSAKYVAFDVSYANEFCVNDKVKIIIVKED